MMHQQQSPHQVAMRGRCTMRGADASVGATMAAAFTPGPVVSVQNRFAAIAEDEAQAPSPEVHISVGGFSHGVMPTDGTG